MRISTARRWSRRRQSLIVLTSLTALFLVTCAAGASWANDDDQPPRDRVADSSEPASETNGNAPADRSDTSKKNKKKSITIGNELTLDLTGRIEGGLRGATPAIGLDAVEPEWQDRRLGIKGTAFKRISFEVARELGEDVEAVNGLSEKTAWRDVYVRARITKAFSLQAGHFKLPFGYEELTGETDLDFIYRSLAARVLSPGRDVGMMVDGRSHDRRIEYQAGYFTRDGDNARTSQTEGGRDAFAGRVVFTPFASSGGVTTLASLHIGADTSTSHLDSRLGLRGRTVLGDGIFFDRSFVNGRRQRIGADLSWAGGPLSFWSEYVWDSDQRLGMGFNGDDLPSVRAHAWYAAGTWALTGERKHGRIEPRHQLLDGGIGALELVARLETLRFADASFPGEEFGFPATSKVSANRDRVATIGLNWYVNHYLKVQGDLIRESVADPQRSPAPATGGQFTSALLRFQFRL
jgi:phosphate-selective porin